MNKLILDLTNEEQVMIQAYIEAVKSGNDELRAELADSIALIVATRASGSQ